MTTEQMIAEIKAYAADNRCYFEPEGEVGFGRECVGVLAEGKYPDYEWHDADFERADPNGDVWVPPDVDAYHKHECIAVLGRGPRAIEQLHAWVVKLRESGAVIERRARQPENVVDLVIHGIESASLVVPGVRSGSPASGDDRA
jgi:hypothetical protein